MKYIFEYRLGYRLIYRFGSVMIDLLLIFYLLPVFFSYEGKLFQILYILSLLFLLFFFNKYYLNLYKIMPCKIEADEEKIVCSKFMFSSKTCTLRFDEIDKLSGGIFDGKLRGLMKVYNQKEGITLGFFHKIHDAKTLETLILSKVSKGLYNEVIGKLNIKKDSIK